MQSFAGRADDRQYLEMNIETFAYLTERTFKNIYSVNRVFDSHMY